MHVKKLYIAAKCPFRPLEMLNKFCVVGLCLDSDMSHEVILSLKTEHFLINMVDPFSMKVCVLYQFSHPK